MRKLILAAGLAASLGVTGLSGTAAAQPYYYRHHHHYHGRYERCRYERHRSGAIGAVAGAVGGGLIGSALTHGRAGGTFLGAGAGALTGHALARGSVRC